MKILNLVKLPKFRKWLQSKKPCSPVGMVGDPDSCPIATYLQEGGYNGVRVNERNIIIRGRPEFPTGYFSTPVWAGRFITAVDSSHSQTIQARSCLRILDLLETAGVK